MFDIHDLYPPKLQPTRIEARSYISTAEIEQLAIVHLFRDSRRGEKLTNVRILTKVQDVARVPATR